MPELDPRLITVGFELGGELKTFNQEMMIQARGMKYANPLQNNIELKIANLSNEDVTYLLTELSPFNPNPKPKKMRIEAGRQSTGTALVYYGDITACIPSQPPDVVLTLKSQTGQYAKGTIVANSQPGKVSLSKLSKQVADSLGLNLRFEATDKNISNYNYSGADLKQVERLGETGAVDVYIDDNTLVVKNFNVPLTGITRVLSEETGMIGIPELTEQGVKVRMLLDTQTKLGGGLKVDSKVYPTVNGEYVVYQLGFDIASRDTPFYFDAWAKRRNDG